MRKVIAYIATSLDGFIARPDDDVSWLDPFNAGGEDYGFAEFLKTAGTAVMGARTYEQSLIHPERLLSGVKNYVLTSRFLPPAPGSEVVFWHGPLTGLVRKIRAESKKDIYIVGGGRVISRFLDEGLIDEFHVVVNPVALGKGKSMFDGLKKKLTLRLTDTRTFDNGSVLLSYAPAG